MLQDTSSYDQYRWKNLICKEKCTKCAQEKSAYVCSIDDVRWSYCLNCHYLDGSDKELLRQVNSIRTAHKEFVQVFTCSPSVPTEVRLKVGVSNNPGPFSEAAAGYLGACPEPIGMKFMDGIDVSYVGRSHLHHLSNNPERWAIMIPLSVSPGLLTGWAWVKANGKIFTTHLEGLPKPEYTFLHVPKVFEEGHIVKEFMSAMHFAGMYKNCLGGESLLAVRVDDLNFQRS